MKLIKKDLSNNYRLYSSSFIQDNHKAIVEDCYKAKDRFDENFKNQSTTFTYQYYNIFSLTSGSIYFNQILKDLSKIVKTFLNIKKDLWFQSWMNLHSPEEVLDWHKHEDSLCHGFIAIEPFDSKTIFKNYEIHNKIGNIYIGESNKDHKVIVNKPFKNKRITVAFDIFNIHSYKMMNQIGGNNIGISHFPLL